MEIYVELSIGQLLKNKDKNIFKKLPDGVKLVTIAKNQRAYHFECDSEESRSAFVEFLDDNYINWQDN